jgi:hypothetical protein
MKEHFIKMLQAMVKFERQQCAKHGVEPQFTLDDAKKVGNIVQLVKNYYELEALRKCVFDYNIMPESYAQIKKAGQVLRES